MKLRVGIIGLGETWEKGQRPALRTLSDRFEVRAVCAEVAHLAQQAAREFQADEVDGFRALCNRSDIEAILFLSPQWYGTLPLLAACDAGKAIYCASAFDVASEDAEELRLRIESSGVAFMAEFPKRLSAATIRLKELIATRLGKPQMLFCHKRASVEKSKNRRHLDPQGGFSHELMELVDWCRYVVGTPPTSVFGIEHYAVQGHPDYKMMNLDFSPLNQLGHGATAQISSGRYMLAHWPEAASFRPPAALQVACERGVAFIDLPSTLIWFDEAGRHMESLEAERPVAETLLLQFHRAVTSLLRKTADLEDAYHALRVVQASHQSTLTGQRVFLS